MNSFDKELLQDLNIAIKEVFKKFNMRAGVLDLAIQGVCPGSEKGFFEIKGLVDKDPSCPVVAQSANQYYVDLAQGGQLDLIGEKYGLRRMKADPVYHLPTETDVQFRKRILAQIKFLGMFPKDLNLLPDNSDLMNGIRYHQVKIKVPDKHEGHEIIENTANGKTFKYCRNCKDEVFE